VGERTKVAVIIGVLEVGGAELDIVRNFPRLDRDEFEVVIVEFDYAGPLGRELQRQGIRVISRRASDAPLASAPAARTTAPVSAEAPPPIPYPRLRRTAFGRLVYRLGGFVIRTFYRQLGRMGTARHIWTVSAWVGDVLRRERVDIAHSVLPHSYVYQVFGCLLMRPRAKRVMSRLSLNFYEDDQKLISWLERNILHHFVHVAIGNSRLILDELEREGVARGKLRLLHNGIDASPFLRTEGSRTRARASLGIGDDAFVIVAVGNLHTYKGHRDLIEACALAADDLPKGWLLLIAGRDQEGNRAVYERLVAERGIGDRVRFMGEYGDVPTLLKAGDVFCHPSHHEGLPNAIIEAMAASLPVVATRVGGIPEQVVTVEDGDDETTETGWLVPPAQPAVLARTLVQAAGDAPRRAAMGERASARARAEFSLEKSVATYESIYRELTK
jgi:glycosyltransferase involved in cell wall biosynthesis